MTRVDLTEKFPPAPDEDATIYTDRLLKEARKHSIFRQCSIGWHGECSDQYGESCMCSCHAVTIEITRDQLESWVGRELSDEEVVSLDMAIPNSSIPEAIRTIVDSLS